MLFLFLASQLACSGSVEESKEETQKEKPFIVETLSFPASYLVQRLAGDFVQENCILPEGEDSVTWNPTADEIARVQKADLIVGNGAGFEGWVKTASLPSSKLILSADDLKLIHGQSKTHSHGKGGEHSHGEIDPHTWTSPALYQEQAQVIHDALAQKLPAHKDALRTNLETLKKELNALDQEYKSVFGELKRLDMAANHPSYTYFVRDYNLSIEFFDFDPETEMNIEKSKLHDFEHWSEGLSAPVLLWESEPNERARQSFPDAVVHIYIDPLEQPNGTYDYMSQAKANIKRFQSIEVPAASEKTHHSKEHGHGHSH